MRVWDPFHRRQERREPRDRRGRVRLTTREVVEVVRDVGERHRLLAAGVPETVDLVHQNSGS
jgi:hypothetical protein